MKKTPLITCLIVNYNTTSFLEVSLQAIETLTKNEYRILICDNGSKASEIKKLRSLISTNDRISLITRKQTEPGSIGHGEALDILIRRVVTPYFVTFDADATILKKNWDVMMLENINSTTKAIGTPVSGPNKPADFPLAFVAMYCTNTFKALNCYFLPDKDCIRQGKDTGYIIREKFIANGFKGVVFTQKNTRYHKNLFFSPLLCVEYHYNDLLFASHFGRGSTMGSAKYKSSPFFKIPIFKKVLRYYIGRKERNLWIQKCKHLILKEKHS